MLRAKAIQNLTWRTEFTSQALKLIKFSFDTITVKSVCNDHPRDPKIVAIVERYLLFNGSFMLLKKMRPQNSGHCRQVVAIQRWSLA